MKEYTCSRGDMENNKIVSLLYQKKKAMDLQSDLKWIHKELDRVKDSLFIETIKSMLMYNKK